MQFFFVPQALVFLQIFLSKMIEMPFADMFCAQGRSSTLCPSWAALCVI